MARFALAEQPGATAPVSPAMTLLREVAGRFQAKVKQSTQAIHRLPNLLARVFPELANLTDDITTAGVLPLLDQYPTAQRIAQAQLASLPKIPYLAPELAEQVRLADQQSVACLTGDVAEARIRDLVAQVRPTHKAEAPMRQLLSEAFAGWPVAPHVQVVTIPGIGTATAAAIVGKAVDIHRFAAPAHFVGYCGVFPEENSSGVDKDGKPLPQGSLRRSRQGNDRVRHYLGNAARSAIGHHPAIAARYRRRKDKGTRGDVAWGHCLRKRLPLVFAVWKTNRPFDPQYFAEIPTDEKPSDHPLSPPPEAQPISAHEEAVGHQRDLPAEKVVTTAKATVAPPTPPVKPAPPAQRPRIDVVFLRQQVTMPQALEHLGRLNPLRGRGLQRRGGGPLPSRPDDPQRTFSAPLGKNLFPCFHADGRAQGKVLDLWAAVPPLPLYEAALHWAETFPVPRHREEEPVNGATGAWKDAVNQPDRNGPVLDTARSTCAPTCRRHSLNLPCRHHH